MRIFHIDNIVYKSVTIFKCSYIEFFIYSAHTNVLEYSQYIPLVDFTLQENIAPEYLR